MANEEKLRLQQASEQKPWRKWGPYLSERQWGTVREDRSPGGDAWNYLSHDAARSRAYRWGDDGLAGVSDDKQRPGRGTSSSSSRSSTSCCSTSPGG